MRFSFTIEVEVQRTEGKFASRDEIGDAIEQAITDADPGELDGLGADGASSYEVTDWSVTA